MIKASSFDDYRRNYVERESVRRKPITSRYDNKEVSKASRASKNPSGYKNHKRAEIVTTMSYYDRRRTNDTKKSFIIENKAKSLEKKGSKSSSMTPIKAPHSSYSNNYKDYSQKKDDNYFYKDYKSM